MQLDQGRAPVTAISGSVPERLDLGMASEERLHPLPLETDALAVDEPFFQKPEALGFFEVGVDDIQDVARPERMEVEKRSDR